MPQMHYGIYSGVVNIISVFLVQYTANSRLIQPLVVRKKSLLDVRNAKKKTAKNRVMCNEKIRHCKTRVPTI